MTETEFVHTWRKLSQSEFLHFERILHPLHYRRDICAFLLLDRLLPRGTSQDMVCAAEHDLIGLDAEVSELAKVASTEDILTLLRCGVTLDDYDQQLVMYA